MELMRREDFPEVLSIIEEAFPPNERRSGEGQRALLDLPQYEVWLHRDGDGAIDSVFAVWRLESCLFGENLASTPSARGKGVGGELLRHVMDGSGKPFFLEVEPPVDELTKRRVGFYERNGLSLNEFFYEQQPLNEGDKPQRLMIMSSGGPISEEDFFPFKREIYGSVYRVEL